MSEIGYISKQFTVWCGRCTKHDQISSGTLAGFKSDIRAIGWFRTRKYGWLCPECRKKPF